MSTPSKKEFQELISFCKKDRFPKDIDIWPSKAKETVGAVLVEFVTCRETALEEMKSLPAFRWLNCRSVRIFPKAIEIIISNPIHLSENWAEEEATRQTSHVEYNQQQLSEYIEKGDDVSANYHFFRTKESLDNLVGYRSYEIQRYERLVADIAYCVMEFLYPTKNITPENFKINIKSIIEDLKKAKTSEDNLEKYTDLFYFSGHHRDDLLQNKLDLYTAISNEYLFPLKRKNEEQKYKQRMFVVLITKKIFLEINPLRDRVFKKTKKDINEIVKFVEYLFDLDCFSSPMSTTNIRNAVKKEINRLEKYRALHAEYQRKIPNK